MNDSYEGEADTEQSDAEHAYATEECTRIVDEAKAAIEQAGWAVDAIPRLEHESTNDERREQDPLIEAALEAASKASGHADSAAYSCARFYPELDAARDSARAGYQSISSAQAESGLNVNEHLNAARAHFDFALGQFPW